jgi:hypothetical protein
MKKVELFAIIFATVFIVACRGGNEGGGQAAGQFNGSLQGQVIMDGKRVDLATGAVRVVVPEYNNGDKPLVTAIANGSEYVETKRFCDFHESEFFDCLIFRDAQGRENFRSRMDGWELQSRLPRISADGQLITVIDTDKQTLLIIDRVGNILDSSRRRVAGAAWTKDGALVYSSGQSIYRVASSQLTNKAADTLIQRFDKKDGKPIHLSVSPDGTRIAFSLSTYYSSSMIRLTVWTINIDGSGSQLFARSKDGSHDLKGWPIWSPDGQWILIQQNTFHPNNGPGKPGSQIALRSDVADHVLDTESDVQIKLRAVCFRRPDCNKQEVSILSPHPIAWVLSP